MVLLYQNKKEGLLKIIDAENLPDFLGGKCTCSHIHGGCVPTFQSDQEAPQYDKHCTIKAREKFIEKMEVKEVPSLIKWSFVTGKHDIRFGLFLEVSKGHMKE